MLFPCRFKCEGYLGKFATFLGIIFFFLVYYKSLWYLSIFIGFLIELKYKWCNISELIGILIVSLQMIYFWVISSLLGVPCEGIILLNILWWFCLFLVIYLSMFQWLLQYQFSNWFISFYVFPYSFSPLILNVIIFNFWYWGFIFIFY